MSLDSRSGLSISEERGIFKKPENRGAVNSSAPGAAFVTSFSLRL